MARKVSTNMSIPLDLTVEILMKLPTKSLARFRCVSYQWASAIDKFIVIDSIVIRSLTQPPRDPHFIFDMCSSYDPFLRMRRVSPQTLSTLSYTYLYHKKNEEQLYHEKILGRSNGFAAQFQYVRGLIGYWRSGDNGQLTIHNPTTSQSVCLPVTRLAPTLFYLFGYDPFKNQYKVVCISTKGQSSCKVFILGFPSKEWWNMECSIGHHYPFDQAVCIDGKIYYKARTANWSEVLVSFDVRFEKFSLVQAPEDLPLFQGASLLVNYQGKLGCICCDEYNHEDVHMWVMEDAEKQEWSKKTFFNVLQDLPSWDMKLAGVTHPGGEIVIVHRNYLSEFASEVFYYDPKQDSRRRVEIQTTGSLVRVRPSENVTIWAVTDHVENLMSLKFDAY